MAAKKSAKFPHKWPDGTWHSIAWADHQANLGKIGTPPPGTYDPNLDAQGFQVQRQLGNTVEDAGTSAERLFTDYGIGQADIARQKSEAGTDYATARGNVETGSQRSLADLLTARTQAGQDYGTSVAGVQRNYANLAASQGGAQRKAGAFAGSGAAIQAASKRAANEALDRAPIDTAFQRFMDASNTSEQRLGEDKTRNLGELLTNFTRGNEALDRSGGQQSLSYQRGTFDLGTSVRRAQDEARSYGLDLNTSKVAQFLQNMPGAQLPVLSAPAAPSSPTSSPAPTTLTAGPGQPHNKVTRKGRRKTYTATLGGP